MSDLKISTVEMNEIAAWEPDSGIEFHDPFVLGETMTPEPVGLPTAEIKIGQPAIAITTEHWHDGTMLFTAEAISVVCDVARKRAQEKGGAWRISQVRRIAEAVRRPMPWSNGQPVPCIHERVAVIIQPETSLDAATANASSAIERAADPMKG